MERVKYFENWEKFAKEIKKKVSKYLKNFKVYVFGSVIRGDYSVGLSDIDIAIVSDEFNNMKIRDKVLLELFEYFKTPFEIHLLNKEQWRFYKNFIKDEFREI